MAKQTKQVKAKPARIDAHISKASTFAPLPSQRDTDTNTSTLIPPSSSSGTTYNVAIIGAGAAGLAAAISAAQQGANVLLIEAKQKVGSKILATGNGRCNLSNSHIDASAYNTPAFVKTIISRYNSARILLFFEQLGLLTHEEEEGRIYPLSNSANSVLDVLRAACSRYDINIVCDYEVDVITHIEDEFLMGAKGKNAVAARKVIVSTGGGCKLLKSCGHTIMPMRKTLCALSTTREPLRGLSGVRVNAKVSAYSAQSTKPYASEAGEVLFRDYGLSGIVIFNLSRLVEQKDELSIDLMPSMEMRDVTKLLAKRMRTLAAQNNSKTPLNEDLLCGMFHPRINAALLRNARLSSHEKATRKSCEKLAACIKDTRVKVEGFANTKNAQVTRGGALVDEFNPQTLESFKIPGLYAAGEVLDVDAKCGGFNLHWAWASGRAAAQAAVRAINIESKTNMER